MDFTTIEEAEARLAEFGWKDWPPGWVEDVVEIAREWRERARKAESENERLRGRLEAAARQWEREGQDGDPVTEGEWIRHCHYQGKRLREALAAAPERAGEETP